MHMQLVKRFIYKYDTHSCFPPSTLKLAKMKTNSSFGSYQGVLTNRLLKRWVRDIPYVLGLAFQTRRVGVESTMDTARLDDTQIIRLDAYHA